MFAHGQFGFIHYLSVHLYVCDVVISVRWSFQCADVRVDAHAIIIQDDQHICFWQYRHDSWLQNARPAVMARRRLQLHAAGRCSPFIMKAMAISQRGRNDVDEYKPKCIIHFRFSLGNPLKPLYFRLVGKLSLRPVRGSCGVCVCGLRPKRVDRKAY